MAGEFALPLLLQGIEAKLRKLCQHLDDIEREILLEASFAMATADGHMAVWYQISVLPLACAMLIATALHWRLLQLHCS